MTDYNRIIEEIEERKKQSSIQSDMVNNPPHYNQAGIECLDAIRAATNEGYEYYLQGLMLGPPSYVIYHPRHKQ